MGRSAAIAELDLELARSPHSWPLLISAEAGCGALSWLIALHVAASEERRDLLVEQAERLPPGPHSFLEALRQRLPKGTASLALLRLDLLSAIQLELLPEILDGAPVLAMARAAAPMEATRAVSRYPGFRSQVYLPPLRDRMEDVEPLLWHFLGRHGFPTPLVLSREALRLCLEYRWPGNEREVSALGARLAAAYGSGLVSLEQLVRVAPEMAEAREAEPLFAAGRQAPEHPALKRVLDFLRHNYGRPVTLKEAAQAAYVSETHLAHLLRQEMGTTFLEVLTRMRIKRACHLLRSRECSFEWVAGQAGFSSLRQMERGFHRYLRESPRSYRRKIGRKTSKI